MAFDRAVRRRHRLKKCRELTSVNALLKNDKHAGNKGGGEFLKRGTRRNI
jgi:hypothetical protein